MPGAFDSRQRFLAVCGHEEERGWETRIRRTAAWTTAWRARGNACGTSADEWNCAVFRHCRDEGLIGSARRAEIGIEDHVHRRASKPGQQVIIDGDQHRFMAFPREGRRHSLRRALVSVQGTREGGTVVLQDSAEAADVPHFMGRHGRENSNPRAAPGGPPCREHRLHPSRSARPSVLVSRAGSE